MEMGGETLIADSYDELLEHLYYSYFPEGEVSSSDNEEE